MEEKFYKVLWIDDEHEGMSGFKGDAKVNGIQFIPYKSLDKGITELKKNYLKYDGVLLDAKFFEFEDDVKGSEDTKNVHRFKEELLILTTKKSFEVFVLTGQAEAYEDKTFKQSFKNVYRKGIDEDIVALFNDIKNAGNKLKDTQLRHEYNMVFDVCTERYIGEHAADNLLELLKHNGYETSGFNQIRKMIEDLFRAFHKYDLLPSEFVQPNNVAISPSSRFLCGKKQKDTTQPIYKKYRLNEDAVLPHQIANYFESILKVTQPGSHRSYIDAHVSTLKTPYLFKSVLYQLMDVMIWFKQYVDDEPKTQNWKLLETDNKDWIIGEVTSIDKDIGYGRFKPYGSHQYYNISKNLVLSEKLTVGCEIEVEVKTFVQKQVKSIKPNTDK